MNQSSFRPPQDAADSKGRPDGQVGSKAGSAEGGGHTRRAQNAQPTRRLSRHRKPTEMTVEEWQVALRRQIALDLKLNVRNIGDEPFFSEYRVTNPATKGTYRVAIRGGELGVNFCSCPDFAVNTLGTCKHIEYVLRALRRKRGGPKAFREGFSPSYSEVFLRYGAGREVIFRPGRECPPELRRRAEAFFDGRGVLRRDAFATFHQFHTIATADGHEVRFYDDAMEFVAHVRDHEELARRIDALMADGEQSRALEALLKTSLYPYQRRGALLAARAGRCLIADEMGLGKTVEAIAAAEMLARAAGVERVLVVCPTSLKHQWRREIETFTDRKALVVEGLAPVRDRAYRGAGWFFKIVNYDVVHRDLCGIRAWRPDLIVLDEAQRIKNWSTRTAKSVKQLESDFAIVLTGTPLENRLEELHSIVEFVDRFRLGPLFRFLAEHQELDSNGRVVGYRNLSHIADTLKPILIRRTKAEVLSELPERVEKRFFVPMTPEQLRHHDENQEIVARIVHKWRRYGFLSEIDQRRLTCALQNMRMCCDSTYLIDPHTDHGHKIRELSALLEESLEEPGAKAVVFSQWLRMHELIVRELARCGRGHVLFHGGLPGNRRREAIERFHNAPDCRVFLSTDAGGVGLNLQNANTVVNVDQPWNPAVLEQRIGRVHRLGQRGPVRVLHLICKDSIEERMLDLLAFKKGLFRGVLDGGQDQVFLGGSRLSRFMETVERATSTGEGIEPSPSPPVVQAQGAELSTVPQAAGAPAQVARPQPIGPNLGQEARQPAQSELQAAASPPQRTGPSCFPADTGPQQQALRQLLTAAAGFLKGIAEGLAPSGSQDGTPSKEPAAASGLIETDPRTGQRHLRVPLPPAKTVRELAAWLEALG